MALYKFCYYYYYYYYYYKNRHRTKPKPKLSSSKNCSYLFIWQWVQLSTVSTNSTSQMVLIIFLLSYRQSSLLRRCPLAERGGIEGGYITQHVECLLCFCLIFSQNLINTSCKMQWQIWPTQHCYLINALLVPDVHLGVFFLPLGRFSLML